MFSRRTAGYRWVASVVTILVYILCLASELNAPQSAHSASGHDHTGITILFVMASGKKSYPRATLRKILKAHSRKKVGKGVDSLVYLDYVLFIEELMQNATRKARMDGEKTIAAKDIRKATMTSLRRFKG
ncbi:hypothetical protein LTR67_002026 [Exophiala xenobiotica]